MKTTLISLPPFEAEVTFEPIGFPTKSLAKPRAGIYGPQQTSDTEYHGTSAYSNIPEELML
jgi:hypothetical protein